MTDIKSKINMIFEAKTEVPTVDNVISNYDREKATLGRGIDGSKYALTQKEKAAAKRKANAAKKAAAPKPATPKVTAPKPAAPKVANQMNFSARANQFVKDLKEIVDEGEASLDDIIEAFEGEFGDPEMEYKGFKKLNGNPWQKIKAYYEYALANYAPKFGQKPGEIYDLFGHVLCTIEQFFDENGRLLKDWRNHIYDDYYSIKTESVNYFPY